MGDVIKDPKTRGIQIRAYTYTCTARGAVACACTRTLQSHTDHTACRYSVLDSVYMYTCLGFVSREPDCTLVTSVWEHSHMNARVHEPVLLLGTVAYRTTKMEVLQARGTSIGNIIRLR